MHAIELVDKAQLPAKRAAGNSGKETMKAHREFADPRSIPLVGRGIRGTIAGTDPLQAVLFRESRGRLYPPPDEKVPSRNLDSVRSVHYERRGPSLALRATRESGRFFP